MSVLFVLTSCAKKESIRLLNSGQYDNAINIAVNKLQRNKVKKSHQEFVLVLEDGFMKAKERDERQIQLWLKDTENNIENIYNTYLTLNQRQEIIRPLLPLRVNNQNRNAQFEFENYDDHIVNSKNTLVQVLYNNAIELLKQDNKFNARKAYNDLMYVNELQNNYKEVNKYLDIAFQKGNNYVYVVNNNATNVVIPNNLLNELLAIDNYGLQKEWTVFHGNKNKNLNYDFEVNLNFRNIIISPEQIKEREITQEKLIKDGVKNLVDTNGNVVRDSLGKVIKVDNLKKVRATVFEVYQFKSCLIDALVEVKDLNKNQVLDRFPLVSEFLFEHYYATLKGDRRACDDVYLTYLNNRFVPFPSNEQMVFDTGTDLKFQLKQLLQHQIHFP